MLVALVAVVATSLGTGCVELEPDPPVDDDGDPIPMPEPGEEWLRFERVEPQGEISTRPTIAVEFNQYLDPTSFGTLGVVRLQSGGHLRTGVVDYRMTRKKLLFEPTRELEPGLSYSLVFGADDIESVVGSPLDPDVGLPTYTADDQLEPTRSFERPAVGWQEVEELFDAHCNDCHADPDWQLPELSRDRLVGGRSEQTDTMLVEPYHPARSYLMHKILPDYPVRRHTVQPPPYSEHAGALSTDDIERIEHWIAGGAPR